MIIRIDVTEYVKINILRIGCLFLKELGDLSFFCIAGAVIYNKLHYFLQIE